MSKDAKFVGGAEMARRNARKRKPATRILRPGETLQPRDYLNKKMPPMERFFASMLKSPTSNFVSTSQDARKRLMGDICRRLGLPIPSKLLAHYDKESAHFDARASLVMEESRHAISESLTALWRRGRNSPQGIRVHLKSMETRKEPGHVVFCFEKNTPFSPRELYDVRPGCCFEILLPGEPSFNRSMLASVVTSGRDFEEDGARQKQIQLMVFAPFGDLPRTGQFRIRPVAALISNVRQFEACTGTTTRHVPFLHALLGRKSATHTRFKDSDDETEDEEEKKEDDGDRLDDRKEAAVPTNEVFTLPNLNASQEKASRSFLSSSPGSLTVVQGPPGTGKSTLLVSIICRYLMESAARGEHRQRRLMVCAPTNKAVTVLVTRYLESISCVDQNPFNVVLIGEQDKLLHEEQALLDSHETNVPAFRVKNMFVYTWLQGVVEDCRYIQRKLVHHGQDKVNAIANRILILCSRVMKSLNYETLDRRLVGLIDSLRESAKRAVSDDLFPVSHYAQEWGEGLDDIASCMLKMDPTGVVRDLLESANVIFCTLASAGSFVVKRSSEIDDLIVDEAAAATEPELYIPFHLRPSRLLIVGDPMQLPATVLSRYAENLGLGKSLHERFMYDLGLNHIMLNIQYRMRPAISQFPSARFYKGKIANGVNVSSPLYKNAVALLDDVPYMFIQVDGVEQQGYGGSYNNVAEASLVVELVEKLCQRDDTTWCSPEKIRIITFYQAQVSLLKRILSERGLGNVVVATVDSSQGCEADIVIVSFVRSISRNNRGNHGSAGFLSDDRRLNVALTRAKYQLICVGNASGLQTLPEAATLHALSRDAKERQCVHAAGNLGLSGGPKSEGRGGRNGGKSKKRKDNRPGGGSQNKRPNKGEAS